MYIYSLAYAEITWKSEKMLRHFSESFICGDFFLFCFLGGGSGYGVLVGFWVCFLFP